MAIELQGFTPTENFHPSTKKYVDESFEKTNTHGAFIYLSSTATTTPSSLGVFQKMNGTTLVGGSNGSITVSDNRIQYTGVQTRFFLVDACFCISSSSASQTLSIRIAKNGVTQAYSEIDIFCKTAGELYTFSLNPFCSLAQNEYIEIWVANKTSTATITVSKAQIRIHSVYTYV